MLVSRLMSAVSVLLLVGACAAPEGGGVPAAPSSASETASDAGVDAATEAAVASDDDGFVDLFNGTDLTGWVRVNGAPGTFQAKDGMIVCDGHPTCVMRTERMYENFVLELEWRHMEPGGNAGLFIWSDPLPYRGQPFTRALEVQVMDGVETENYTSHGDIFSIWGAEMTPDRPHPNGWERCLPSEKRAKPSPEWNHYRLECRDGRVELAVNGKVVSGASDARPRKGYLCLEAEGSEVHFRNLRIQELPPADPPLEWRMVATQARGFRSLYTGVDLSGWKVEPVNEGHWTSQGWRLDYDGEGDTLWSEESFGDFELMVDWRWTGEAKPGEQPVVNPDGTNAVDENGQQIMAAVAHMGDSGIYLRGSSKSQVNIWDWPIGSGEVYGYRTDGSMSPEVRAGVTPKVAADAPFGKWNRFHITMIGDRLTVVLNGQTVLDKAQLPGVAAEGPIALQHHGSPLQFANIFVREIE